MTQIKLWLSRKYLPFSSPIRWASLIQLVTKETYISLLYYVNNTLPSIENTDFLHDPIICNYKKEEQKKRSSRKKKNMSLNSISPQNRSHYYYATDSSLSPLSQAFHIFGVFNSVPFFEPHSMAHPPHPWPEANSNHWNRSIHQSS